MTKTDAIAEIVKLNRSANPMFLAGFSHDDLVNYLDRLRGGSMGEPFSDRDCCIVTRDATEPTFPTMDCMS